MKQLTIFIISVIMMCFSSTIVGEADYFMITDLGTSAKTISLGKTQGVYEGAVNVFENPASIKPYTTLSTNVFYSSIMDEVEYAALSLSSRFFGGSIGIGYMQSSISDIYETAESGGRYISIGTFDYLSYVAKLAYQYDLSQTISLGVSAVYYQQEFYDVSGSGLNADVGLLYKSELNSLSVFAKNILSDSDVVYNDDSVENLPFTFLTTYRLKLQYFSPSIQVQFMDDVSLVSGGLSVSIPFIDFIQFNLGYNQHSVVEEINETYSGGISLDFPYLKLNYSYIKGDYELNDDNHYISLGLEF
jgi:hypothetical protein